jgi:hypothetical protein
MKRDAGVDTLDTIFTLSFIFGLSLFIIILALDAQSHQAIEVRGALAEIGVSFNSSDPSFMQQCHAITTVENMQLMGSENPTLVF